jgi:hypothetical protein
MGLLIGLAAVGGCATGFLFGWLAGLSHVEDEADRSYAFGHVDGYERAVADGEGGWL